MMRWLGLVVMVAGCTVGSQNSGIAAPCKVEIEKLEAQLPRVLDPGRRNVIESLLEEARRALTMRQYDRCLADVKKAGHALRV